MGYSLKEIEKTLVDMKTLLQKEGWIKYYLHWANPDYGPVGYCIAGAYLKVRAELPYNNLLRRNRDNLLRRNRDNINEVEYLASAIIRDSRYLGVCGKGLDKWEEVVRFNNSRSDVQEIYDWIDRAIDLVNSDLGEPIRRIEVEPIEEPTETPEKDIPIEEPSIPEKVPA